MIKFLMIIPITLAGGDNYEGQETIVFNDFRGDCPSVIYYNYVINTLLC